MLRKRKMTVATGLVILGLVIAGCQTAGQSAGLGAILGGATGAIIGNQSGHAAEGALIGAAVGGLAGWAIHKAKVRQMRTAQETATEYKYQPSQGFKMDMPNATIAPGEVKRGGSVNSTMQYVVLGSGNGVPVEESRILKKDNQLVCEIKKETVTRTDGTWENSLEFSVPKDAPAGQYVLAQQVSSQGQSFNREAQFSVSTQMAEATDAAPESWQIALAK